jgi:poly-gamma-glutamate synthesis protein (capsule biosynthesis protein)
VFHRRAKPPAAVFFLAVFALIAPNARAQNSSPAPTAPPSAKPSAAPSTVEDPRALAESMRDGFTIAAVGDLIIARSESSSEDPAFKATLKILRGADVAMGNMEGTLIDIRNFKGYPQAEYGGLWLIGNPEIAKDLRNMNFGLVARANNHALDWGIEGMRETDATLDAAGIAHAGTGETRALARAARFLDTPKGRIGIVSMAEGPGSYVPSAAAMPPLGEAPARPGMNAFRTTQYSLVTGDMMDSLRKIREAQPKDSVEPTPTGDEDKEHKNDLELFGVHYRLADHTGFTFEMNPIDLKEIEKSIRQGKETSDFVVATIHAHDPGNWSEEPADFLPTLAHDAIDAGADMWVGHGPHRLRAIEIYKGKPIFYSLGNFFFEVGLQQPHAADIYEQYKKDPSAITDNEFDLDFLKKYFNNDYWYQSVIAVSRFDKGKVSEIRLYPVDLGFTARDADRGIPRLASPEVAQVVLQNLQRLSQPYNTTIAIEGSVGVIRIP